MTFHRPVLAGLLSAGLLAACASPQAPVQIARTPTEQFAIQVQPTPDEIQLAPHGTLSSAQDAALAALVLRWREKGYGDIVIQAPSSGPAGATAQAAGEALQRFGAPASSIRFASFAAPAPVPVRVGFSTLQAIGPECSNRWGDLVRTAGNLPTDTFGCATTANTAAQVANARDLLEPAVSTGANSRRRVGQVNTYNSGGQPTAAASSGSTSQGSNP